MSFGPIIYKRDSTGSVRTWQYEVDGPQWRTHAGLQDGAKVCSGWTVCTPKSQDTAEGQAQFEADAEMRKKLERDYHADVASIDTPNFFEPMLAQTYGKKPVTFPVIAQPKLDGIRCIATAKGLFSRQGKRFFAAPHIEEALAPFFDKDPSLIFDGELYNHTLKDDFNTITSVVRKQKPSADDLLKARELIEYHIYDLPSHSGVFRDRWTAILNLDLEPVPGVKPVETIIVDGPATLDALYSNWMLLGYEGQMIRLNGHYEQKRSANLLKRKEFQDDEFEVVAIEEGLGNWAGYGKRIVCRLPDGREFGAGVKGNQEYTRELLAKRADYVGRKATVRYFALTPDGIPRFPVAVDFARND